MTLIPAGAQLAPVDLPPPPPSADPREPSPAAIRGRGSRTPVRARSPAVGHSTSSRASSPTRPPVPHHASSESSVQIVQPIPKPLGTSTSPPVPINPLTHHSAVHLSRSPSTTSIDSSPSAIFERDIELPAVASLSLNPNAPPPHTLAHKTSRLAHLSHGSPLDHSIPAVLDDAVEALSNTQGGPGGMGGLEVEAPAPNGGVGMARQSSASLHGIRPRQVSTGGIGINLASRSPSPASITSRASSGLVSPASPPILGQLATQQAQLAHQRSQSPGGGPLGQGIGSESTSPTSLVGEMNGITRPPAPRRISTGPQVPGGWAFGQTPVAAASDDLDELANAVHDNVTKQQSPIDELAATSPISAPKSSSPSPAIPSHLTPTKDKRRISFISYNDLLLSVPTQVTPLEDVTSGVVSPDHLPGTVSPNVNTRSPVVPTGALNGGKEVEHKQSWDIGHSGRASGLGLGDGEWGREGLGKGLEQRLEDLAKGGNVMRQSPLSSPDASTTAPGN